MQRLRSVAAAGREGHAGSPGRRRARRLGALALAAACAISAGSSRADQRLHEYEVKAAFLLNFARLVEWPASAFPEGDRAIVLGVLGRDLYQAAVDTGIAKRKVGGRPVRLVELSDASELENCHIVFVGASRRSQGSSVIEAARGAHVLTVGESPGFARQGGVINFYQEKKKIRFEINPEAARRARLKISSRLLHLAKLVTEEADAR